eukprot:Amastigsp_a342455_5.p3 type:complete len:148 gc:universal Amastigsp_a342455_5:338-781(+)
MGSSASTAVPLALNLSERRRSVSSSLAASFIAAAAVSAAGSVRKPSTARLGPLLPSIPSPDVCSAGASIRLVPTTCLQPLLSALRARAPSARAPCGPSMRARRRQAVEAALCTRAVSRATCASRGSRRMRAGPLCVHAFAPTPRLRS